MIKREFGAVLALSLLAGGCATLDVAVDIYDGPLVGASLGEAIEQVRQQPVFIASERTAAFDSYVRDVAATLEQQNRQAYEKAGADPAAAATQAKQDASTVPAQIRADWAPAEAAASAVATIADQASAALAGNASASNQDLYAQTLGAAFDTYVAEAGKFRGGTVAFLARNLQGGPAFNIPPPTVLALLAEKTTSLTAVPQAISNKLNRLAASDSLEGRAVGFPIFDADIKNLEKDPDSWERFVTNHFKVSGGNAQFVVVRDGLVVYRQKSLDFDPTPVIGAGAALTRLGLKVAAAVSVGKISSETKTSGQPAATDNAIVDLAKLDRLEQATSRRRDAQSQVLFSLADLYRRLSGDSSLTDDELTKSITDLKSILDFYDGQITALEE